MWFEVSFHTPINLNNETSRQQVYAFIHVAGRITQYDVLPCILRYENVKKESGKCFLLPRENGKTDYLTLRIEKSV